MNKHEYDGKEYEVLDLDAAPAEFDRRKVRNAWPVIIWAEENGYIVVAAKFKAKKDDNSKAI